MKTKLILLLFLTISGGCKTQTPTAKMSNLIKSQHVDYGSEYAEGWNAALENLEHHLKQADIDRLVD